MISINVNPAASGAGLNLGKANDALQKSLSRLSSGRRIVNSSDDAGGLAVSMKMAAAQKRTEATAINLRNVVSYLDTQDGAFKVADKVLSRMSELSTLARDVTKNGGDVENYNKEFENLKAQLTSLSTEKFNGQRLFSDVSSGERIDVPTSEDGSQLSYVSRAPIAADPMMDMMINGFQSFEIGGIKYLAPLNSIPSPDPVSTSGSTLTAYQIPGGIASPVELTITASTSSNAAATTATSQFTISVGTVSDSQADVNSNTITNSYTVTGSTTANTSYSTISGDYENTDLLYENSDEFAYLSQEALQQVADMRAQNGAEMSRINFAQDLLDINAVNLEAANSRIIDVDVAAESSQLARFQILQQAGTAMLAQANTSQQSLVRLLQG
jgi:flagellin-like hook-associated protein FlgL